MPDFKTDAENNFYGADGIATITSYELEEMGGLSYIDEALTKLPENSREEYLPPYSSNRTARLFNLLDLFKTEIKKNILIFSEQKLKSNLIEDYIKEATKYKASFESDYYRYLNSTYPYNYLVAGTHQQINIINSLLNKLISLEEKEETTVDSNFKNPAVASIALAHVFWSKFDDQKQITKTNSEMWANKYGVSKNTLLKYFKEQCEKTDWEPDQMKIDNKKYLKPYFKRFEDAVKMLEPLSDEAFKYAKTVFSTVKEKYKDNLS